MHYCMCQSKCAHIVWKSRVEREFELKFLHLRLTPTERWWFEHIWEFIAAMGMDSEGDWRSSCWRSSGEMENYTGYTSPGFYPWVSGSPPGTLIPLHWIGEAKAGKRRLHLLPHSWGCCTSPFIEGDWSQLWRQLPVCPFWRWFNAC